MKKVYLVRQYAGQGVVTQQLQAVIDDCAANGGGQVRFEAGTYLTATLELRSNVELYLDAGAIIRGVEDYTQYYNHYWEFSGETAPGEVACAEWFDALICAYHQTNIAILGEGIIDGVDCQNPSGEQQFRGPHGIFLYRCENIALKGFTVVRSANYALQFRECGNIHIDSLKMYGGQDAIRITGCHDALTENCDFRTGDDCISGVMNTNLTFLNCRFNTPGGNMFLVGCHHLRMRGCKFWGPGEYPAVFKEEKRYSNGYAAICMLHDTGEPTDVLSDDWLLEDIDIENVEMVFRHDREVPFLEGYQGRVVINGIRAVNFALPMVVTGPEGDPMDLTIRNGVFIRRSDREVEDASFLKGENFKSLTLENIRLEQCGKENVMMLSHAGSVQIKNVTCSEPIRMEQMNLEGIGEFSHETKQEETIYSPYVVDQTDSIYVPVGQDETFRGAREYVR